MKMTTNKTESLKYRNGQKEITSNSWLVGVLWHIILYRLFKHQIHFYANHIYPTPPLEQDMDTSVNFFLSGV